jgi:hypothetical protein
MRRPRLLPASLAIALGLVAAAGAEERGGSGARSTKRAVKEAARDVGHATRDVARTIGHATRDITREIGHAFRDLGRKLRD